jgi:5-hydroxyisourate hydrolase
MARISTHVLDIAKGTPASGITVELYRADYLVKAAKTNPDGRTSTPLLSGDRIAPGTYELVFHVDDYLRAERPSEPLFFDRITIRFAVSEQDGDYHVPLLLAAHGYSTYRGS